MIGHDPVRFRPLMPLTLIAQIKLHHSGGDPVPLRIASTSSP